jgi:hypothetical protein
MLIILLHASPQTDGHSSYEIFTLLFIVGVIITLGIMSIVGKRK